MLHTRGSENLASVANSKCIFFSFVILRKYKVRIYGPLVANEAPLYNFLFFIIQFYAVSITNSLQALPNRIISHHPFSYSSIYTSHSLAKSFNTQNSSSLSRFITKHKCGIVVNKNFMNQHQRTNKTFAKLGRQNGLVR